MCFSPKIKTPKVDTNQIVAPTPAPLTEGATSVSFGGNTSEDDTSADTGTKSTTVAKTTKSTGIKGAIRSRMSSK